MPFREHGPEHVPEHDADLAAVPSFRRDGRDAAGPAGRPALVVPRPATPAPVAATPTPSTGIDPAALPMPSLSRRRLVTAAGIIAASLLALSFLRQVGEASDATNRADELRAGNAALQAEVARLQRDVSRVQDPRYILLAGRAYGLGGPREIPFALAAGAPALADDAPGSASVRLGAPPLHRTPLEAWLEVLFGPGD
jgi:cell division protein FtsB